MVAEKLVSLRIDKICPTVLLITLYPHIIEPYLDWSILSAGFDTLNISNINTAANMERSLVMVSIRPIALIESSGMWLDAKIIRVAITSLFSTTALVVF